MNQAIQDSTILISGGTGSFGKTMATHLLQQGCREIRVFSRDEWKQDAMRVDFPDPRLKFYLGDVRSRPSVDDAMAGVDMVFHAAALKQVPSCEFFPMQAVLTNIIGSANILDSAVAHGVQSVVLPEHRQGGLPGQCDGHVPRRSWKKSRKPRRVPAAPRTR